MCGGRGSNPLSQAARGFRPGLLPRRRALPRLAAGQTLESNHQVMLPHGPRVISLQSKQTKIRSRPGRLRGRGPLSQNGCLSQIVSSRRRESNPPMAKIPTVLPRRGAIQSRAPTRLEPYRRGVGDAAPRGGAAPE